jgi:hypothetical protein
MSFLPLSVSANASGAVPIGLPMPYLTPIASKTKPPVEVVSPDGKRKTHKNTVVYEMAKPSARDALVSKGRLTAVERRKLGRLDANDRISELLESKPKKSDIRKWFESRIAELCD